MPATKWIWNYFTLENICNAKCRLCDNCVRPTIPTVQPLLFDHIIYATDNKHQIASKKLESFHDKINNVNWDEYYHTLHSTDNMFDPNAKCKCCDHEISNADSAKSKRTFLYASPEMKSHLKEEHEVDESNWIVLNNLIKDSKAYYYITELGKIKGYTCKKCINDDNESRAKNAIMFAKHMIDKHCEEFKEKFSRDKVPKELLPLYDSTVREDITLSSNIADRSDSSRQDSLGVSSESTQFSRKRKEEVLKMSEPEVSTQIEEPPYKRRKCSSTDDSD